MCAYIRGRNLGWRQVGSKCGWAAAIRRALTVQKRRLRPGTAAWRWHGEAPTRTLEYYQPTHKRAFLQENVPMLH